MISVFKFSFNTNFSNKNDVFLRLSCKERNLGENLAKKLYKKSNSHLLNFRIPFFKKFFEQFPKFVMNIESRI